MKILLFINLSVLAALAATSCKPETKIAGQSVTHWIERLDDANPNTKKEAWRQLQFASDDDIRKKRRAFEKIADSESGEAGRAVWMLYERLGEVNIKWIAVYVEEISPNSLYGGRGAKALKQLELIDKKAVVSGLEKYVAEGSGVNSYPSASYVMEAKDYLMEIKKR